MKSYSIIYNIMLPNLLKMEVNTTDFAKITPYYYCIILKIHKRLLYCLFASRKKISKFNSLKKKP